LNEFIVIYFTYFGSLVVMAAIYLEVRHLWLFREAHSYSQL